MMLHQYFDTSTRWNLQNCSFVLPNQIVEGMKATPFSCDPNAEDSLLWAYSKNGSFSLNSAYLLARGLNPLNLDTISMSCVWKTIAPPRIQFCLWLCMHNILPIGEVLGSRCLNLNLTCPLCSKETESIEHLLRSCEFAQAFRQKLNYSHFLKESFNKPLRKWLEVSCNTKIASNWAFHGVLSFLWECGTYGCNKTYVCLRLAPLTLRLLRNAFKVLQIFLQ